jgi:hypothetical protein
MVYPAAMKAPSRHNPGRSDPDRDQRLADALRENLRRRKAQARAKQGPVQDATRTPDQTANPPERSPSE